jgi:hypothetical protein
MARGGVDRFGVRRRAALGGAVGPAAGLAGAAGASVGAPPEVALGGTQFWTVADRGPNVAETVAGEDRVTFPLPEFAPSILRLERQGNRVQIVERIPLRLPAGFADSFTGSRLITGLSSASPASARTAGPFPAAAHPAAPDPPALGAVSR